jgi:predicted dinucleotide-binding enzyme
MRLAIIGAGSVGGTLGSAWAQKAGHDIFFGVNRLGDAVECRGSGDPRHGRLERPDRA